MLAQLRAVGFFGEGQHERVAQELFRPLAVERPGGGGDLGLRRRRVERLQQLLRLGFERAHVRKQRLLPLGDRRGLLHRGGNGLLLRSAYGPLPFHVFPLL